MSELQRRGNDWNDDFDAQSGTERSWRWIFDRVHAGIQGELTDGGEGVKNEWIAGRQCGSVRRQSDSHNDCQTGWAVSWTRRLQTGIRGWIQGRSHQQNGRQTSKKRKKRDRRKRLVCRASKTRVVYSSLSQNSQSDWLPSKGQRETRFTPQRSTMSVSRCNWIQGGGELIYSSFRQSTTRIDWIFFDRTAIGTRIGGIEHVQKKHSEKALHGRLRGEKGNCKGIKWMSGYSAWRLPEVRCRRRLQLARSQSSIAFRLCFGSGRWVSLSAHYTNMRKYPIFQIFCRNLMTLLKCSNCKKIIYIFKFCQLLLSPL